MNNKEKRKEFLEKITSELVEDANKIGRQIREQIENFLSLERKLDQEGFEDAAKLKSETLRKIEKVIENVFWTLKDPEETDLAEDIEARARIYLAEIGKDVEYVISEQRDGLIRNALKRYGQELVRDFGPQAPTYRRSTGVLHDRNTGQELPCGSNSRKPLDDTNVVRGHKIDNPQPLSRLLGDGQIRILEEGRRKPSF